MNKIMTVVAAALALAGCSGSSGRRALYPGVKTPENSKLFVRHVDPHSGVVSYLLRPGLIEDSHKQLYFTSRSMTEDGRFLVVDCACNEYSAFGVYRPKAERKFSGCKLAVIDLLTEKVYRLYDIPGQIPFLDVDNDELFYARFDSRDPDLNWLYKRELLKDPLKEVKVCRMPEELTKGARSVRYFCHLTLSHDRTLAFLDSRVDDNHVQGVLNVRTGEYTKWYDAGPKNIFHGQINPVRNDIALCCWECVPWTDSKGVVHDELVGWEKKHPGEPYPRLQLCEPGKLTMVPTQLTKYATHERWNEQGDGFYWCSGGVYHHDLATGVQTKVSPKGTHAFMSVDRKYVVSDCPVGGWWRGCAWQVYFHNRETDRGVYVFTYNEPLCPRENPSHLHPDPHPQFVCGDRYVISTVNHSDGHMDCAVTPVDQLVALTERRPVEDILRDLPAAAEPVAVGTRLAEHFLETPPDKHGPKGCTRTFKGDAVPYAVVSLWINALEFARQTKNADLEKRLLAPWRDFRDGGAKARMRSQPYHVDFTIFGAIPYQVYLQTGDAEALKLGNWYADTQWREPPANYKDLMPKWLRNGDHYPSDADLKRYLAEGYSPQTRLWIDDMYMITVLQTQAYRATGKRTYLSRAVKEALLYLDRLQLKDGPVAGLFYHAPDVKYVWGRGDGWMAAGMPLILKHLNAREGDYHKILEGYQRMMAALLKYQREDGLWGQLVDGPDSWSETSGSAMFAYAFIEGVKNGWLDASVYGPAARKAWVALCGKLDEYGNLKDVCVGTGKKDDRQYYLDRDRLVGDPHGQAPMLWCVNALLEPPVREDR